MTESNLIAHSGAQRIAWARVLDNVRSRQATMIAEITKLNPPPPMTVYDPRSELAWNLQFRVNHVRAIFEAVKPTVELILADAADYCGAKVEHVELIDGLVADLTAGLINAADELQERV